MLNHRISFFDLNPDASSTSTYVRNYSSSREILGNLLNIYFELNNQAKFQISTIFHERKCFIIYHPMNIWYRQPKDRIAPNFLLCFNKRIIKSLYLIFISYIIMFSFLFTIYHSFNSKLKE